MTFKSFLKRAGIGALTGIAADVFISVLSAGSFTAAPVLLQWLGSDRAALMIELLLVAVYGAVCMATTVIYDSDAMSKLPLSVMSLLHCFICVAPFVPLSLLLGWCGSVAEILITAGIQIATYFIIWLIMYIQYKKQIKELNEIQKVLNEKEKGDGENK